MEGFWVKRHQTAFVPPQVRLVKVLPVFTL